MARSFLKRQRRADEAILDLVALSTRGQRWGQPGRCPECGELGYLDKVDLIDRELYQHCPGCDAHWITAEADLEPADTQRA